MKTDKINYKFCTIRYYVFEKVDTFINLCLFIYVLNLRIVKSIKINYVMKLLINYWIDCEWIRSYFK